MPDWKAEIRRQLAHLNLPPAREAAIVEELAQDLADGFESLIASGISEAEACRQTLAELHDSKLLARELPREERKRERAIVDAYSGTPMPADLARELYYGARTLAKNKGFTLVAVFSLALGFALVATTFAVVNAYLIRSLPFPAADRLHLVSYTAPRTPEPRGASTMDWKDLSDVVEAADASQLTRFYIGEGAAKREALGLSVASGAGEMLGLRTVIGRPFLAEEYRAEAEKAALIGYALWQERFGADPNIVGRSFQASRSNLAEPPSTFRIVGVLPPDFHYAREYARGAMEFAVPATSRQQVYLVRLRAGVSVAVAEQRITEAVSAIGSDFPPNWRGVKLESAHESYVKQLRPLLLPVAIAAGLVLVIVCVNVAVLLLLRSLRRQKEIAVRAALGAGRNRIVRMLAAEIGLLCGAAFVIGLASTQTALRLLAPIVEQRLGRGAPGGTAAIALDTSVLLLMGGAGVFVAVALSFIPMITPWEKRLADALRREGRSGTDGPTMRRLRSGLIALEVALSVTLLAGCGLMIRSVVHLVRTDLGFQTEHVVRARIALPNRTYPDPQAFLQFYERLREHLAATTNAPFAFTNFIPFYEYPTQTFEADADHDELRKASVMAVSEGYFDLLGIRIQQGRGFTAADREGAEPVAIISETLARRLWPQGNAIGRRIRPAEQADRNVRSVWRTIVGVARDARQTHTDVDLNDIYLPFMQAPSRYAPLYFRTDRPASVWLAALRTTVAELDQEVLVSNESTLDGEAVKLLAAPRFLMSLLTGFAAFAVLLALLGIYGVTAYAVQQREREIAIRLALGATPGAILRLFLRQGGLVLALGIAGGLLGANAVAKALASQLHGVPPFDVVTLVGACAVMAFIGLAAILWPARRAAQQDPMRALNEN
ncbi:MAG: ABC transporter permease [Acidobacteria bacterium]|nr:ABC transporter permease [Acidobacteriota bacterium]